MGEKKKARPGVQVVLRVPESTRKALEAAAQTAGCSMNHAATERLDGMTTKAIMRRALADRVPPAVLARRDKMGFETPADLWLRGRHAAEVRRRLLSPGPLHEWLDATAVATELDDYFAGRRETGAQVWRWLSLESWLRQYVVNPSFTYRPAPGVIPARRGSAFDELRSPDWAAAPGAASR